MKYLDFLSIVGVVTAFLTACADPQPAADAAVYLRYCALCHGEEGLGYQADGANALANPTFLASVDDDFLRTAIVHGRPGTPMSAWSKALGGPLSDADVEAIIHWLRSKQPQDAAFLAGDAVGPGVADRGVAVYNVHCRSCHGEAGAGKPFLTINNPWFLHTISDAWLRHVIVHGRPDTPMPGFGQELTRQNVDDLVVLIRSWQRPPTDQATPAAPAQWPNPVQHAGSQSPDFASQSELYVEAAAVKAALDNQREIVLVDARPTGDYSIFHLPGAVSVPFYAMADLAAQLPAEAWTVTYCGCPHAESTAAAQALIKAGHEKVKVLDEGILFWQAQGWPLHTGNLP